MQKLDSIGAKSVDQRFKEGDQQAFVELHESLSNRYKYLAYNFNIDFDDLKGILAETMFKLLNRYDPETAKFSTYLAQNLPSLIHRIKKFKDLIQVEPNQDRLERQMLAEGQITETTRQRLAPNYIDTPIHDGHSTFHEILPSKEMPFSEVVAGNVLINRIAVIIATKYPNDPYAEYILETLRQRQRFPKALPKTGPYSELKHPKLEQRVMKIKRLLREQLSES